METAVKQSAAPDAEQIRKQNQGSAIRVVGRGNAPSEHQRTGRLRKFAAEEARPPLARLARQRRTQGRHACGHIGSLLRHGRKNCLRVHIAADANEHVTWHIVVAVIAHHVAVSNGIEAFPITDDGITERITMVQGLRQGLIGDIRLRVVIHGHFAADHLALALELILRESRMQHKLHQEMQELPPMLSRAVNMEHGAVISGVGIPLPAQGRHALIEFRPRILPRALENHVLQQVRDTYPRMHTLIHRTRLDPHLNRYQRQSMLLRHHRLQPICATPKRIIHVGRYSTPPSRSQVFFAAYTTPPARRSRADGGKSRRVALT